MRFDLVRPCPHCPFRTNEPGFLGAARATEIVQTLVTDDWEWFGCHQTTVNDESDEGERVCNEDTQQCAGSLLLLLFIDPINVPTRLAIATGVCDIERLDRSAPVVQSAQEFIDHHTY